MEQSISKLRKKSHTKKLTTHPVLLTLEYKAKQIKLLIQSALDCQIGICTRVDIVSPNGINTSADFRLTSEQIKLVWQAKPQAVTLYLQPPEHLKRHLPAIFEAIVSINGLFIDKINADSILHVAQANFTPPNNKKTEVKLLEEKARALLAEQGRNAIRKSSKYQSNIKLKEEAIRLYNLGKPWKSTRQASIKIVAQLNDFATENKISPLSLERAQTTIYGWLRHYVKDMA